MTMSTNAGFIVKYLRLLKYALLDFSQVIGGIAAAYLLFSQLGPRLGLIKNPLLVNLVVYSAILIFSIFLFFLFWIKVINPINNSFSIPFVEIKVVKVSGKQWDIYKKLWLVAQRNDVARYIDKVWWSGAGDFVLKTTTPKVSIYKYGRYLEYSFNRYLREGESVELDMKFICFDEDHVMQPYIGTTIKHPTDKLALSVVFPEGEHPEFAQYAVSKDKGNKLLQLGRLSFHGSKATIEFPGEICRLRPRMGYYYRLSWEPR